MPRRLGRIAGLAALVAGGCAAWPDARHAPGERYGIGRAPTAAEIRGWDIDVSPDGAGLPAGSGTVAQGRAIYAAQCAACHGADGQGAAAARLVGGHGSLASAKPLATIGSFWPYATTLYDYVYRAMPFDRPQSLRPDEVYAVTAYLLHLNGIIAADSTMSAETLAAVRMPNHGGFEAVSALPDLNVQACMRDCR